MKTKKKLAGVQEKHRGFDNDTSGGQSLSRSYGRSNSHHDPVRIQKALLAEIENIEVNHERRKMVIKEAEPRWAMQRFRNKTYEKAKFEKVGFDFCRLYTASCKIKILISALVNEKEGTESNILYSN